MVLEGKLVLKDRTVGGSVRIEDGRIAAVEEHPVPAGSCFIMPGFVDLHTHGSGGFDFMDGSDTDITGAAESLARHGTTTCLPTTLTSSDDEMMAFFANFKKIYKLQSENRLPLCARMPGLHLEGPYFDMEMKGAQNPRYIRNPEPSHYNAMLEAADGHVKRWSVAPELPGAMTFIDDMVRQGILVSAAHTAATYDVISQAYDHGLSLMTHFYSAMSSITKKGGFRILGAVEAGYLIDGLGVELICDGLHLPPELLRLIFKNKDHGRIIACSDSMRGAGMPEGPSVLGPKGNGTPCIIEGGIAKMPDRTCFAGSVATGDRLARTLHCILGLGMDEVSRILCLQPAELIGMDGETGSIEEGKCADLVVCDDKIDIRQVYVNGNAVL